MTNCASFNIERVLVTHFVHECYEDGKENVDNKCLMFLKNGADQIKNHGAFLIVQVFFKIALK